MDVAVVGGGPAGLSAALILGRALKRVCVFDAGERRNAAAEHLHGFVTRDGTPPTEFRQIAREQLRPYDVGFRSAKVTEVRPVSDGFVVAAEDGSGLRARRVILAMGMVDEVPAIPGMREGWGRSVFQCPHCHGFEHRGKAWGVMIPSVELADFALMLSGWTRELTAFTGYPLPPETEARLAQARIRVETRPVERLVVEGAGELKAAELRGGARVPLDALFLKPKQHLPGLVRSLGVELDEAGFVRVTPQGETSIPGLYAAGDLTSPLQVALAASYQGAMAAWMIVHALNVGSAK